MVGMEELAAWWKAHWRDALLLVLFVIAWVAVAHDLVTHLGKMDLFRGLFTGTFFFIWPVMIWKKIDSLRRRAR